MIYIASDHAGFKLKKELKKFLDKKGYEVRDMGPYKYNKNDDYPDFIKPLAKKISKRDKGVIIGGSGQGEAIVANRFKGVRAIVYYGGNKKIIKLSRQHNNANVLSLGARFLSLNEAKEVVELWLNVKFSEEKRHIRRIKKIK